MRVTILVYASCPSIVINSAPFYSEAFQFGPLIEQSPYLNSDNQTSPTESLVY